MKIEPHGFTDGKFYGAHLTVTPGKSRRLTFMKAAMDSLRSAGAPFDRSKPFLKVVAPCGHEVTYNAPDDLPEEDVPCPCGNPNHWMVKFEEVK